MTPVHDVEIKEPQVPHDRVATSNPAVETKLPSALAVKNVLFATDFSATSEAAMPYAAAIARRYGSTLHVAHVLSDAGVLLMTGGVDYVSLGTLYDDAHNEARQKLEQLSLRFVEIPHHSYVGHGPVWTNLAGIIAQQKIDLIVLGTHGRTGLGKLFLGSVAEDILRHAPCPVLTVGPKVSGRDKLPALQGGGLVPVELDLRQILFATNFDEKAILISNKVTKLAQDFGSHLTLMHVIEDYVQIASRPKPIEDGHHHLRTLIPPDTQLPYMPDFVIEFGFGPERILKVARDREADLIVVGARSAEESVTTHLPWSTTHQVLVGAHCPVLTLRG
jgi:nucleotide-binding universal stress UspA family protein